MLAVDAIVLQVFEITSKLPTIADVKKIDGRDPKIDAIVARLFTV